jgi:hypothetical protein
VISSSAWELTPNYHFGTIPQVRKYCEERAKESRLPELHEQPVGDRTHEMIPRKELLCLERTWFSLASADHSRERAANGNLAGHGTEDTADAADGPAAPDRGRQDGD